MEEKEEEGGRLGRAAGAETGARTHDGELITHIISPQIDAASCHNWRFSRCLGTEISLLLCVCVCQRRGGGREITVYLKWLLLDSILALQALYLSIIFSSLADKNIKLPIRRGPGC